MQERFRKCDRPPPAFGGLDCRHIGPALESRECNNIPCPGECILGDRKFSLNSFFIIDDTGITRFKIMRLKYIVKRKIELDAGLKL